MRCSSTPETPSRRTPRRAGRGRAVAALASAALLLAACLPTDEPGALAVRGASVVGDEGPIRLEATLDFHLGPAHLEALHAGVPIRYEWRAEWRGDGILAAPLARAAGQFEIDYRDFTGWYLLHGVSGGEGDDQPVALPDITAIEARLANLHLPLDLERWPDGTERVRLRIALDVGALPPTLRLPAYVSKAWQQDSGWHAWRQQGPLSRPEASPGVAPDTGSADDSEADEGTAATDRATDRPPIQGTGSRPSDGLADGRADGTSSRSAVVSWAP